MTEEYLTPEELAKLLKVDRKTIYALAKDGRLPHARVGRQIRFNKAEVLKALGKKEDANQN